MTTETIASRAPSPGIYRMVDIPYLETLMTYQQSLRNDFLAYHTNWYEESPLLNVVANNFGNSINNHLSNPDAWKVNWFRYETAPGEHVQINHANLALFPTMRNILQDLEPYIGHLSYDIMEPNSEIRRYTAGENRASTYLRIHIPLIIPEGDCFFEVNGEEITWDEPFGFNNQYPHSSHNLTNERRLVAMIDLRRDFLGLPPCLPYYSQEHLRYIAKVPPFTRSS